MTYFGEATTAILVEEIDQMFKMDIYRQIIICDVTVIDIPTIKTVPT